MAGRVRRRTSSSRDAVMRRTKPSRRPPRAFTLIEVMVVVVIISIAVGVIAPRMAGLGGRRAERVANEAARLLTLVAERDELSELAVGLEHDAEAQQLRVMAYRRGIGWTVDQLAFPVSVGTEAGLEIVEARAGDRTITGAGDSPWRVEFTPTEERLALWMIVQAPGGSQVWTLWLGPRDRKATKRAGRVEPSAFVSAVVDLDRSGTRDEPW